MLTPSPGSSWVQPGSAKWVQFWLRAFDLYNLDVTAYHLYQLWLWCIFHAGGETCISQEDHLCIVIRVALSFLREQNIVPSVAWSLPTRFLRQAARPMI